MGVELKHGHFAYVDLMAHDYAAALDFYARLFGWTTVEMPTDSGYRYAMFRQGDDDVAGIGEASDEMKAGGAPSMWTSYILVDDVDAVANRVTELGGTVAMPPMDVGTAGRMAIIQDPTAAAVSLWEARENRGSTLFNVPNSLAWNELITKDPLKARAFYDALLGWGWICNPPAVPDHVPNYWDVYFAVEDVDATAARAVELGGQILVPPKDIGVGRFAGIIDAQGAGFSIFKSSDAPDAE